MKQAIMQLFAVGFSAYVFQILPPVDLSRAEAWTAIMFLYALGLILACTVEEHWEKIKKRRKGRRRRA